MKMNMKLLVLPVVVLLLMLAGCSTTKPPTHVENTFFTVVTNYVPIVVPQVVIVTNEAGTAWHTNLVYLTNWAEGYDFAPNTNATAVIETGTAIGNFFGVGGLVGTILAALFGMWAKMRGNSALKTAGVLAEIIEAGRKVLASTPQGASLESNWVAWMSKHQTETGVILEVAKLLKQVVNNETAKKVADQLILMAQKDQPAN
jgi:hypothetical protein